MTSPTPELRCLSCGYDVASLITHRGRETPGVCPECGEDLDESIRLAERRPQPVRDYLRFVRGALLHPLRSADNLARRTKPRTVSLLLVNLGATLLLLITAHSIIYGGHEIADGRPMAAFSAVATTAVFFAFIMLLVTFFVTLIAIGLQVAVAIFLRRPGSRVVSTALSIATVWFIPASLFLSGRTVASGNYAVVAHGVLPSPAWHEICLTVISLVSISFVPIVAFCVMLRLRPTSKRPSPSNLELP